MRFHAAAYALTAGLGAEDESRLYDGLADMELAGLEQPFFGDGRLHARDDAWLLERLRPEWSLVLTLLPGVMEKLKADRDFGLASLDEGGRTRALDFARQARRTVEHLNRFLGRPAVLAVELHSAPRLAGSGARSSVEALAESLSALRALDWMGATLLLEHCDAPVAGREPEKGFLPIEDDALALKRSEGRTPAALSINWGRSALETRSLEGPVQHLGRAAQSGQLGALFFSGVAPRHPLYGAWKDSHAPFSTDVPESLLTPAAARAALEAAPGCPIVGVKVQALPPELPVERRLALLRGGLEVLRSCPIP
jgi:hypothetical protein